jgi:Protein of unknown function (DUF3995)
VAWGRGGSWPFRDREALVTSVLGIEGAADGEEQIFQSAAPTPAQCYAVAAALTVGAALVAGRPKTWPRIRSSGVSVLVTVLGVRGLLGLTGRTHLLVPAATGGTFVRLDRRYYGPLCVLLAGLSSTALPRRR